MVFCFEIARLACERLTEKSLPHVTERVTVYLLDIYAFSLQQVVEKQNVELLKLLLLDAKTHYRFGRHFPTMELMHAMNAAVLQNQLEMLRILIDHGPAADVRRHWSTRILEIAVEEACDIEIIKLLLHSRQNVCSIAMAEHAAATGRLEVAELVANCMAHEQVSPLSAQWFTMAAASHGQQRIIEFLWRENRDVREDSCVMCIRDKALEGGHLTLAAWLDALEEADKTCGAKDRPRITMCFAHHLTTVEQLDRWMADSQRLESFMKDRDVRELQWFVDHFPNYPIDHTLIDSACEAGDVVKVLWLVSKLGLPPHHEILQHAINKACAHGHLQLVKSLIRQGVTTNALTLDAALTNGHLEMVLFLQEQCAVTKFDNIDLAIHLAASHRHVEIAQRFDSQRKTDYPAHAFYSAAHAGNVPLLRFLLATPHSASVSWKCLKLAFRAGHLDALQLLLKQIKAEIRLDVLKRMLIKVRKKQQQSQRHDFMYPRSKLDTLWLILDQESSLSSSYCCSDDENFENTIAIAASNRHFPLIKWCHDHHASGFSTQTIEQASASGSLRIVRFLAEHRPEKGTVQAANRAAVHGFLHIVKFLREQHGVDPNVDAVLVEVACEGHWHVVQYLCEGHHPLDDRLLSRAFLEAASHGQIDVVEYFLTRCSATRTNNTVSLAIGDAFRAACVHGQLRLVQWLVANQRDQVELSLNVAVPRRYRVALDVLCVKRFLANQVIQQQQQQQ